MTFTHLGFDRSCVDGTRQERRHSAASAVRNRAEAASARKPVPVSRVAERFGVASGLVLIVSTSPGVSFEPAQAVPGLQVVDVHVELPGDGVERVAPADLVGDPARGRVAASTTPWPAALLTAAARAGASGDRGIRTRRRTRSFGSRRAVVGLGEVRPADVEAARERGDAVATLHRVPLQRGELGRRRGSQLLLQRRRRCPGAPE